LIKELIDAANACKYKHAALHFDGAGIDKGIAWQHSFHILNNFRNETDKSKAGALETIMCGACWPNARVHGCHPEVSNICQRCKMAIDTSMHCFWMCTANDDIADEAVSASRYLIKDAITSPEEESCMWLRGLLPLDKVTTYANRDGVIVPLTPPVEEIVLFNSGPVPDGNEWPSGTYYGDGSGGEYTAIPTLRRCGVGVCIRGEDGTKLWGVWYALPGEIQTVARAELSALSTVVEHAQPGALIRFVSDNKNNVKFFNKGKDRALGSSNQDMFASIFRNIEDKGLVVRVVWIPSHTDKTHKELPDYITQVDVQGNKEADVLADTAAHYANLPLNETRPVLRAINRIKVIQRRLAAIVCSLPKRVKEKRVKPAKLAQPSLEACIAASRHTVVATCQRVTCLECRNHVPLVGAREWLKTCCIPFTRTLQLPVQVGHLSTHVSHNLGVHSYQGITTFICTSCGNRGSTHHLAKLARECTHVKTTAGKNNIKALRSGSALPGAHSATM